MASNPFVQLQRLLPGPALLVGTVVSGSGGVLLVELPGGARVSVRGSAAVGARVFVKDGRVDGDAPSLPTVNVEV